METGRIGRRGMISLFGVLMFLFFFSFSANADIPRKIGYQGYLTDAAGVPVNGTLSMIFSIYSVSTGGSALWTETQNVNVEHGVYSVSLGDATSIALNFDVSYYLGVAVGTDPEMTPRKALKSVGYAFRASTVDSVPTAFGTAARILRRGWLRGGKN